MKMKTIEEKAKRYDDLLVKLQEAKVDNDVCDERYCCVIDDIVPELAESEDERIRKWLIEMVGEARKANPTNAEHNGMCSEAIAWLEKQGKNSMGISEATKQKLEDKLHEALEKETPESFNKFLDEQDEQKPWSEEGKQNLKIEGYENLSDYEKIFDDIADKYVRNKNQKGYNQSWYVKERAAEMLYQANKELKKKVNWSEEDEDIRDNIIRDLKRLSGDMVSPNQTYQKEIQWLKDLKDRVQPQPQQEWSDKDCNQIETIACHLDNIGNVAMAESLLNIMDKYKSSRPQSTWKPSDEQIKVCKEVYADILSAKCFDLGTVNSELNRLEEELKKLKGE